MGETGPNEAQTKAMGEIVADNIGAHIQTGRSFNEGGYYLHVQHSPGGKVKYHFIDDEGTVKYG